MALAPWHPDGPWYFQPSPDGIRGVAGVHTSRLRFANDAAGFEQLDEWVGAAVDRGVYESTGPGHRAFEESLAGKQPLARANPTRARPFAPYVGPGWTLTGTTD